MEGIWAWDGSGVSAKAVTTQPRWVLHSKDVSVAHSPLETCSLPNTKLELEFMEEENYFSRWERHNSFQNPNTEVT